MILQARTTEAVTIGNHATACLWVLLLGVPGAADPTVVVNRFVQLEGIIWGTPTTGQVD